VRADRIDDTDLVMERDGVRVAARSHPRKSGLRFRAAGPGGAERGLLREDLDVVRVNQGTHYLLGGKASGQVTAVRLVRDGAAVEGVTKGGEWLALVPVDETVVLTAQFISGEELIEELVFRPAEFIDEGWVRYAQLREK
jgi:hypothetical protein